jgi:hypothetical protein
MKGKGGVLVGDLDGTPLGDRQGLVEFSEWNDANRGSMSLVYASGRFFSSVVESI